ncbi:MAG: hypothetical protein SOU09_12605 [Faecalimonas umbilicata]|uniref:hypothetical protein n=1 Tax=Faecalimonas umbilicata TaxID=1912855 RepID=UPI002A7537B2|nr:hypothetical protein [Faecalimonas umbilicata]MDY2762884.1 hypothetical protein [Faecalimonas umbilicata]
MFKIFKKHPKTLWISMQDVLAIIKSDYDKSWPFEIIEFRYGGTTHRMGAYVEDLDEKFYNKIKQEEIHFVFDEQTYTSFEEFVKSVRINGIPITDVLGPIEVLQAGIVNGEAMLSSPWGEKRLSAHAIEKE